MRLTATHYHAIAAIILIGGWLTPLYAQDDQAAPGSAVLAELRVAQAELLKAVAEARDATERRLAPLRRSMSRLQEQSHEAERRRVLAAVEDFERTRDRLAERAIAELEQQMAAATRRGDLDQALALREQRDAAKADLDTALQGLDAWLRVVSDFHIAPPADAVFWEGHWYKAYPETRLPWHLARQQCLAMGGHLARIDTGGEQEFLANLARSANKNFDYWIDGSDAADEGNWKYGNGASVQLQWGRGQPNNGSPTQHGITLFRKDNFNAHDWGLGRRLALICEWSPESLSQPRKDDRDAAQGDSEQAAVLNLEDYKTSVLNEGAIAFSNRGYRWNNVPKRLNNWFFIVSAGGGRNPIEVTVEEPGRIFVLVHRAHRYVSWKFEQVKINYSDRGNATMILMSKTVDRGSLTLARTAFAAPVIVLPPGSMNR